MKNILITVIIDFLLVCCSNEGNHSVKFEREEQIFHPEIDLNSQSSQLIESIMPNDSIEFFIYGGERSNIYLWKIPEELNSFRSISPNCQYGKPSCAVLNLKENKNEGNSVLEETLIASADSLFNLQNYIEALNMTIDQNTDSLKIEFTLNDIQGLWSCRILEEHEYPAYVVADSPFYWKFINQSIYINGDSLWRLCFPCEIYSGYKIALSNDTIYHYATKERLGFISKDTSKFYIRDNEQFVIDWGNRAFHVDSFGTFNMQKLIRDSLNYSSLLGGMKLITDNQEPGNADPLTFPVKMPLELHIEAEEQAKQLCKSKEIYLRINGRKRKFIVEFIDWSNDDIGFGTVTIDGRYHNPYWRCYPVVRLKPGDWWKGKSFVADYK